MGHFLPDSWLSWAAGGGGPGFGRSVSDSSDPLWLCLDGNDHIVYIKSTFMTPFLRTTSPETEERSCQSPRKRSIQWLMLEQVDLLSRGQSHHSSCQDDQEEHRSTWTWLVSSKENDIRMRPRHTRCNVSKSTLHKRDECTDTSSRTISWRRPMTCYLRRLYGLLWVLQKADQVCTWHKEWWHWQERFASSYFFHCQDLFSFHKSVPKRVRSTFSSENVAISSPKPNILLASTDKSMTTKTDDAMPRGPS